MEKNIPIKLLTMLANMHSVYDDLLKPICQKYGLQKNALNILLFLANNPDYNTAKDITNFRCIKPSLISFHVEKLVECGYIERQEAKGDRRKQQLFCTKKASAIIAQGRQVQKHYAQTMLQNISKDDLSVFKQCLEQIGVNATNYMQKK